VTYRPPRCARRKRVAGQVIGSLRWQAPLVICIAASFLVASSATADPIASKQAEAQRVLGEIQQIDASMERAVEAYDRANAHLGQIRRDLHSNRQSLRVARGNLTRAQAVLAKRMVAVYTSGEEQSTLAVLLGSRSLDDLLNRLETVNTVSAQDAAVIREVRSFKGEVTRREHRLTRARAAQSRLVASRAADKVRIRGQLAARQALLSQIKDQIAHLQAVEQARQAALQRRVQARLAAQPPTQAVSQDQVGVAAATPEATVAPPSRFGGVVGIAMGYLGTPYRYGGADPSGFDCSGFVAYVYGQMGISLPHYSGAQYAAGVAVSRNDLQPGDLVFFNGLSHVGIYVGGGNFIHAPHTGDVVKISSLSDSWYASTYVGARRIP
jgi:cell wall-associated NlpC family hydrolase